jgi:internalin A
METPGLGEMTWLPELIQLEELILGWAPVSSIQGLANLTHLRELYIPRADVVDISPLARLVRLRRAYLSGNQITDLSPLVANHGLGHGDLIRITGNPLNVPEACPHIGILIQRGTRVDNDLDCG